MSTATQAPERSRSDNPATRLAKRLVGLWRRSLQFRVVATTLVLGLATVSVISVSMYRSIADGLVDDRIEISQAEARQLTIEAQNLFDESDRNDNEDDLAENAGTVVRQSLAPPDGDTSRYVILTRSLDNETPLQLGTTITGSGVGLEDIPPALREAVSADPERQQTTTIDLERTLDEQPQAVIDDEAGETDRVPAVVVGSQVTISPAGPYDLYMIYPMDQEQSTLDVISRSFLLGSAFLILLVSAIAYVVTRTVVSPVRRAAEVATRLAGGDLNERMSARGHDDLAQLGRSFNEMADNLQTQIRQLEGLSRVQQRFVSDVSHELRTPLTTIRMAADVLDSSKDELDPVSARSAELLSTELDRFEALLADLLEISRYDAGAAVLEQDPTDLVPMIERVVAAAASIAEAAGSEVRIHGPGPGEAVAEVDTRRVERILRNLVVNAVEHGEGRPVDVWVAANEDAVAVVVEDHGVGLRPGEGSLVFNRFWRADPARTRTTGGTGLGLAISLEDARLHHGWLQAWGEPGNGSRFRLTLPRRGGGSIGEAPLPLTPREGDLAEAVP